MAKRQTKIELLKEKYIEVIDKDSIIAEIYNVQEITKKEVIEYKKIVLRDENHKFNFYERLCFKTIYDENENPIGREIFSKEEFVNAINRVNNILYKPLNLNLGELIENF